MSGVTPGSSNHGKESRKEEGREEEGQEEGQVTLARRQARGAQACGVELPCLAQRRTPSQARGRSVESQAGCSNVSPTRPAERSHPFARLIRKDRPGFFVGK
jgi:hypothetical protein